MAIREVLKSNAFLEKVLIIVVTGALSGALIPFINARSAEGRAREVYLLTAKANLLEEIERTVLTFQHRAMAVAWYRSYGVDTAKARSSWVLYDDSAWSFFVHGKSQVARVHRYLDSSQSVADFRTLVYQTLGGLDRTIVDMVADGASGDQWRTVVDSLNSLISGSAASTTERLAVDLGLLRHD